MRETEREKECVCVCVCVCVSLQEKTVTKTKVYGGLLPTPFTLLLPSPNKYLTIYDVHSIVYCPYHTQHTHIILKCLPTNIYVSITNINI